jgi:hypothetical protein
MGLGTLALDGPGRGAVMIAAALGAVALWRAWVR